MPSPPFELPVPDLGRWRAGNTGTDGVWRFEAATPGRDVLVTALVHGNELCGAWAALAALEAGLRPRRGALSFAFCNLAAFDRFDAAAWHASRAVDEDLNRVWGAMAWRGAGAQSVEQRRALELLPVAERADRLLDLHSMHDAGPPLVLTGLQPRNVDFARAVGAPALVVADAGHAAGCRLRDHGRFDAADADTRSLLVECGFHGGLAARDVAIDVLGRFLVAAGSVDAGDVPAGWLRPLPREQRVLDVTAAVTARSDAPTLVAAWRTGDRVPQAGTLLGHDGAHEIRTPYADCTLVMPGVDRVRAGQTIVRLARPLGAKG